MRDSIRGRCGLPKNRCAELVDGLFEAIKKTLESGEDVRIIGLGKFSVKDQNKRRVRNPPAGEAFILDARRVVTFLCCLCVEEEDQLERWLMEERLL